MMKDIITILLVFSPLFLFSQSKERILVCKEKEKKVWLDRCLSTIDSTATGRALEYYTKECTTQARTSFCDWKDVLLIKEDTIYCETAEKKKYIKLCNE